MHCFHCTVHTRSTSGLHILQNIKQWLCQQWIHHTSNSQAPNHLNYYWGSNKRYDSMHHPRISKMMKINNFSIFLSCSWWESHRLWPVWSSVSEGRCSRGPPTDPHRCDTNTNPTAHNKHTQMSCIQYMQLVTVCTSLDLRAHMCLRLIRYIITVPDVFYSFRKHAVAFFFCYLNLFYFPPTFTF